MKPWFSCTGAELLARCAGQGCGIAGVMRVNERHWRSDAEIDAGLDRIWAVMQACVQRGLAAEGVLPGGFQVRRRAAKLHRDLTAHPELASAWRSVGWAVPLYRMEEPT